MMTYNLNAVEQKVLAKITEHHKQEDNIHLPAQSNGQPNYEFLIVWADDWDIAPTLLVKAFKALRGLELIIQTETQVVISTRYSSDVVREKHVPGFEYSV